MDISPKGDAPGFVRVLDDRTLAVPDRPVVDHDNIWGADYFDSPPEADPPVIQ